MTAWRDGRDTIYLRKISSPRSPESSGVQLQPIATSVEMTLCGIPVAGLLKVTTNGVINCLQLRPTPQ